MELVRRLLARRGITTLICCAVLALKLLVPTGYMVGQGQGHITISICSGMISAPVEMSVPLKQGGGSPDAEHHGDHAVPCPYGSLAFPALPAADPIQLEHLLIFIFATALAAGVLPAHALPAYLRPPLRGPPLHL